MTIFMSVLLRFNEGDDPKKKLYCIYVAVGQKRSTVAQVNTIFRYFNFLESQNFSLVGSVVEPDPPGSAFIWLSWILIRNGNTDPDPDPGACKLTKFEYQQRKL
jgi:hypothetical protein